MNAHELGRWAGRILPRKNRTFVATLALLGLIVIVIAGAAILASKNRAQDKPPIPAAVAPATPSQEEVEKAADQAEAERKQEAQRRRVSREWERLSAVGESVLPWALLGVGLAVVVWMIFYLWQAIPLIVILGGLGSLAMGWVGAFVGLCVAVVCATILLAAQSILASMATLATPPCKECGARPAQLHWESGTKLCEECRESREDEEEKS